jgi:hypothetical protein
MDGILLSAGKILAAASFPRACSRLPKAAKEKPLSLNPMAGFLTSIALNHWHDIFGMSGSCRMVLKNGDPRLKSILTANHQKIFTRHTFQANRFRKFMQDYQGRGLISYYNVTNRMPKIVVLPAMASVRKSYRSVKVL